MFSPPQYPMQYEDGSGYDASGNPYGNVPGTMSAQEFGMGPGYVPPPSPYAPPPPVPPMPQAPSQPPTLPDPTLAANPTGGPAGPTAPIRAGVYTQLYKMGRQMPGGENMFGQFGPQETPPTDPLSLLPPAQEQAQPQPMLRAQPAPQMGPGMQAAPKKRTQGETLAMDRFPRLARFMGRSVVPPPDVNQQPQPRQRQGGY